MKYFQKMSAFLSYKKDGVDGPDSEVVYFREFNMGIVPLNCIGSQVIHAIAQELKLNI